MPLWLRVALWLDVHLLHPLHYIPWHNQWLCQTLSAHVCFPLERHANDYGE